MSRRRLRHVLIVLLSCTALTLPVGIGVAGAAEPPVCDPWSGDIEGCVPDYTPTVEPTVPNVPSAPPGCMRAGSPGTACSFEKLGERIFIAGAQVPALPVPGTVPVVPAAPGFVIDVVYVDPLTDERTILVSCTGANSCLSRDNFVEVEDGTPLLCLLRSAAGLSGFGCLSYTVQPSAPGIPSVPPLPVVPSIQPPPSPTISPLPEPTFSPEPLPTVSPEPLPTVPTFSPEPLPTFSPEPLPTFSPEPLPTFTPEPLPTVPTISPEPLPTLPSTPPLPTVPDDPATHCRVTETCSRVAADGLDPFDVFGYSVAIDGDTSIVGSPLDDDAATNAGAVYVFVRDGAEWVRQAKLVAPDAGASDWFGRSVAIDGDTVAVGAFEHNGARGAVYVFTRTGTAWSLQQKLTASDAAAGDQMGQSVALEGDTLVASAVGDDDSGIDSGSAYVFTRSAGVWTQRAKIKASDGAATDGFGNSLGLSGGTIAVAAATDNNGSALDTGAVYVFVGSGGAWSQQAKIVPSDNIEFDRFGSAVALSGDTFLAGAVGDDVTGSDSGSVYVYTRTAGVWSRQAKLVAPDTAAGDAFGTSVALLGDRAVVGARYDEDTNTGSAHVFTRTAGAWSHWGKLTASDAAPFDELGASVAVSEETALAGAPLADHFGSASGAMYHFEYLQCPWAVATVLDEIDDFYPALAESIAASAC